MQQSSFPWLVGFWGWKKGTMKKARYALQRAFAVGGGDIDRGGIPGRHRRRAGGWAWSLHAHHFGWQLGSLHRALLLRDHVAGLGQQWHGSLPLEHQQRGRRARYT